jgi:hypothetical protein
MTMNAIVMPMHAPTQFAAAATRQALGASGEGEGNTFA